MTRTVVTSNAAAQELTELYDYIANAKSAMVAKDYVDAIIAETKKLGRAPFRGRARDDVRPGMRVLGFRRRVHIIFTVTDDIVQIGHILYGGRDHVAIIRADANAEQRDEG
ncbi:MAG: type II toxin-antitoxin system RelE/ParE family toxin [Actinomycetia bacterium]|nr:type II toxin-antitoxin system RelE/ParE family toxin [Actinomycetes bacterium]